MIGMDDQVVRAGFPLLGRTVRDGRALVYLDSAATAHKPLAVLDATRAFYTSHNAAVHRGAHQLAEEATEAFEGARSMVAAFVGVDPDEIVWTSGATAALNTVAYAFGNATAGRSADGHDGPPLDGVGSARFVLAPGDEIVVTEAEHHANLIPWQELCARTGAVLRWFGVTDDGRLDLSTIG
ncbi:MAG: aminotransferase class V-fold PLP-dependent enzyme, partial [Cellulomonadaceae bacterium]|nr:aminotransferase class V-fold PLP-dependent enzyme [Cellulomonadaceae bacterium]